LLSRSLVVGHGGSAVGRLGVGKLVGSAELAVQHGAGIESAEYTGIIKVELAKTEKDERHLIFYDFG
jgi:hypothetical protein